MTTSNPPSRTDTFWVRQQLGLWTIQNNRFVGYASQDRAKEYETLVNAHTKLSSADAKTFLDKIKEAIKGIDRNDSVTLNRLWDTVLEASRYTEFNRIVSNNIQALILKADKVEQAEQVVEEFLHPTPGPKLSLMERIVQAYQNAKKSKLVQGPVRAMKTILDLGGASYTAGMSAFTLWNTLRQGASFGADHLMMKQQTIPAVVGLVPIPHVKEIEVARSGKILKFRATGSVFLANQEGGLDAIRIEGYFYRVEISWILILWMLFLYGRSEQREIDNDMLTKIIDPISIGGIAKMRKIMDVTKFNSNESKPSYEFHHTFPIVTRHIIIPNCYIETLSFEERVINGKDTINYSILLRTYTKVKSWDIFEKQGKDGTTSYIGPHLSNMTNMGRMLEPVINMIWRGINASGIIIKEREWKLEGETDQGLDVTYDISAEAIAMTTIFSIAGCMGNFIPNL